MFIQRYILFQLFYTQGFPPDPKMLYDERASLQSKLATFEDEEAAEEYIAGLKQNAEAGRTPQE